MVVTPEAVARSRTPDVVPGTVFVPPAAVTLSCDDVVQLVALVPVCAQTQTLEYLAERHAGSRGVKRLVARPELSVVRLGSLQAVSTGVSTTVAFWRSAEPFLTVSESGGWRTVTTPLTVPGSGARTSPLPGAVSRTCSTGSRSGFAPPQSPE